MHHIILVPHRCVGIIRVIHIVVLLFHTPLLVTFLPDSFLTVVLAKRYRCLGFMISTRFCLVNPFRVSHISLRLWSRWIFPHSIFIIYYLFKVLNFACGTKYTQLFVDELSMKKFWRHCLHIVDLSTCNNCNGLHENKNECKQFGRYFITLDQEFWEFHVHNLLSGLVYCARTLLYHSFAISHESLNHKMRVFSHKGS